jgi:hypothetical protein
MVSAATNLYTSTYPENGLATPVGLVELADRPKVFWSQAPGLACRAVNV